MNDERLFEVPVPGVIREDGVGNQAVGTVVEQLAIAELLLRGHKVAIPVVDDDGVDLVVDYRFRVQVKASAFAMPGGSLIFHTTCSNRRGGEPFSVDAFLFYDLRESSSSLSRFFVVPTSVMSLGKTFLLSHRYTRYRAAWHVIRELAEERAA